ncbi:protein VASCULAR ASSOCIATED DEATH 1, chloroplastic isoform X1 [Morus notabilis]|uniref:protein VASCULAR ASSOCIATED DEATH 1, chloroplastic isoform X1 n=2 Tax=Morus notabilis TaxID=981085 RepID=UPI000CED5FDA|nr:protein VASCULAR ASSOCIATED DEATH 1, chloroplastic isoform X1 [Morus notabilis]
MAVASAPASSETTFKVPPQPTMEPSPSRLSSDAALESSSSPLISSSAATPDRDDPSNSSPNSRRDLDIQSQTMLRSEEYRQLFRLPPEEVLVEDFNCAFQENILIQGHMYLFVHYICFYSNIFGFETKKLIAFHEVTSVRRAKTAGIFPNAIEIFAGGKKYFFASFLSRDEAFKIINDGWLQHSNGAKAVAEQQESTSGTSSQENGVAIEKVDSFRQPTDELDSTNRTVDIPIPKDFELPPNVGDDKVSTIISEVKDILEEDIVPISNTNSSSMWKEENCDAPNVPEWYTMVAESEFPIKAEDFFNYYFSDNAVIFIESFHKSCGDKEIKCSSWYPNDNFGHARDVSFQHPIKLYFGAKFGGCQETQKFRLYRNSHLVIETSQELSDVPYADYFHVEALWDIERDADESKECCSLRVYVNVAFSKRTVWKGKIVQSTLEECREAYATWINMAHELLKNLEKQQEKTPVATVVPNGEIHSERAAKDVESSGRLHETSDRSRTQNANQQLGNLFQGRLAGASSFASWLREIFTRFCSSLESRGNLSLVVIIIFFVILLMQLSILVLLARPQHIHVHSPADYMMSTGSGVGGRSSEAMVWLEKRVHHLKDEMYMVEARLERMRHEHALLKAQLKDLMQSSKRT